MTKEQFDTLKAIVRGEQIKPPVALLVDSPWIPPFAGIDAIEYFTEPEKWLDANLKVVQRFPNVIFIPGFWVEYGMAIEPSAHGCKVSWWKDSPPSISPVLDDISEAERLRVPSPQNDGLMPFVLHLQRWANERIQPLGYAIRIVSARGPLALATFLRGITEFLVDIKIEPEASHRLLDICTDTVIRWLDAQARNISTAKAILVLDDIVGLLSPKDYEEFAHPYLKRIFDAFPNMLKLYHNDANVEPFAERLAETGFHILNFSHLIDPGELQRRMGEKVVLMGNVPPLQVMVEGTPDDVRRSARRSLERTNGRIILSAGGGTNPGTSAENIDALVQSANEWQG